jgi:hypothetical protein
MDLLEELSAYMSLINIDILEYLSVCKGFIDLTNQLCSDIQNYSFNLRKIESHLLTLKDDYFDKYNFLDSLIPVLKDKIKNAENKIIPYGPAFVARSVCKKIMNEFEGEIKQYLEKLEEYLYLIGRYINQNLRVYKEEICIN